MTSIAKIKKMDILNAAPKHLHQEVFKLVISGSIHRIASTTREFDMTKFEWDESIVLGIQFIDKQHKALFDWMNSLHEAITEGDGKVKVEEIINNLIKYVIVHFSEEERLMLSWNYPALGAHRKEHDHFTTKLQDIQSSFNAGNDMSADVLVFMVDWLVCHIKGTDIDYSRFIHEGGEKRITAPTVSAESGSA